MAAEWFYSRDGKNNSGPVTVDQLQALAGSGQLLPSDLVWKEGMPGWQPAGQLKGLSFPVTEAPPPPPRTQPPSAPVGGMTWSHQDILKALKWASLGLGGLLGFIALFVTTPQAALAGLAVFLAIVARVLQVEEHRQTP
jgi:hypothetical protein